MTANLPAQQTGITVAYLPLTSKITRRYAARGKYALELILIAHLVDRLLLAGSPHA